MALYTVPKAVLVKVFEQQPQHWQGNSSKATTLHTATALVVNLPVKVKARTSKFVKIKEITSKAPLVT